MSWYNSWSPDTPNPCVPPKLQHICKLYVSFPFAAKCRSNCSYCFEDHRYFSRQRWWNVSHLRRGMKAIAESYGPCFMVLSGLEPFEEILLVKEMLTYHYASACTNLMFDHGEFESYIPPERMEIHPTFHPHLWKSIDVFLNKIIKLRDKGYAMPLISVIGHPLHLPKWDEWIPKIESIGIMANPVPMRQAEFQGRSFPKDYSQQEKDILNRYVQQEIAVDGVLKPLRIKSCAAGHATFAIMTNGDIKRCVTYQQTMGQNLFRDGDIRLLPTPEPCNLKQCLCGNLHPFHITE
jgi:hypothetical protein